jgi:outer membrane protein insertion porin family
MKLRVLAIMLVHCLMAQAEVVVRYEGVTQMQESLEEVVKDQLAQSADTAASGALADDLAFFARRHYQAQGYPDAAVAWRIDSGAVVLIVTEGMPQVVGETTFPGNPDLDEQELRRYLLRPTKERVGKLKDELPFVQAEIADGMDLVHRYILSQGYIDSTVAEPVVEPGADGKVKLTVTITPGIQWSIREAQVKGAPARLEKLLAETAEGLNGQVLNEARVEGMRRGLEGQLQAAGWFAAKVAAASSQDKGERVVDLTFTATTGPLHEVDGIIIDPALSNGARRLISSVFRTQRGQKYDAKRLELDYGRVVDTGLFEHLDMDAQAAEGSLDLHFQGEEAKRHSLGMSIGYDTFQGPILGVEYKDVNFWGNGSSLTIKALGSQLGYLFGIIWRDPAFWNSPYAVSVSFMPESFSFIGYQRLTVGSRVAVSRQLSRNLTAEGYFIGSYNGVSSDTLGPLELGPEEYAQAALGGQLIYEGRDNPVMPTRGWYGLLKMEQGYVGSDLGDLSYSRADFALSYYKRLTPKWRTSAGLHWSSLLTGEDVGYVPIDLRTFNGGANAVRSFLQRRLGPRARDGTPLGGTQSETLAVELSYEIAKNLELAGFVDVGSINTERGAWLPQFDDLRYAAGLGLRYRLPFGPLRVDYGVNLNRRTGESIGALHVGFGFAF